MQRNPHSYQIATGYRTFYSLSLIYQPITKKRLFLLKKMIAMFTIISIMFVGIGIGYVLRNLQFLQKIEKSTSLTIFLLLFVLGISIGSNSLIINNLGRFGWQAAILATLSILGSMLASFLVFHLFFKKGGKQ